MTYPTTRLATCLLAGCLIALVGCESDGSNLAEFFPQETRTPEKFAQAHARQGARDDAMLQPHHFDGPELNSLGQEKLDMMADGQRDRTLTVYLNFGENDMMDQRRDAVIAHLGEHGFDEGSLRFVSGSNPARTTPAAANLTRMHKTETTGEGAGGDSGFAPTGMGGTAK